MDALGGLTKDLSNTVDSIGKMYDQSTGTAPSVPQIQPLLQSQGNTQDTSQQNTGALGTGIGIAGAGKDAYDLYKTATDPLTHGLDTAINVDKKLVGDLGVGEGLDLAASAIPGIGTVATAGLLGYQGIAAGANYLQHDLNFKGLLR